MSYDIHEKVVAKADEIAGQRELAILDGDRQAIAEADPYNQLTRLVVEDARDLKQQMIRRNRQQQQGWAIANLLLRRNIKSLGLTSGTSYDWSNDYYVGIETPPAATDGDTDVRYAWVAELRHQVDTSSPQAFYSETDAGRSDHYWAHYGASPVYIYRTATSRSEPEVKERELWYTIYTGTDSPIVVSGKAAGDTEQVQKEKNRLEEMIRQRMLIDADYPGLEEIREKYAFESAEYGFDEAGFNKRLDIVARRQAKEAEFDETEPGKERLGRLNELEAKEKKHEEEEGAARRAGSEALSHCLGLLAQIKAELQKPK